MKKLLTLTFIGLLAISFTACNTTSDKSLEDIVITEDDNISINSDSADGSTADTFNVNVTLNNTSAKDINELFICPAGTNNWSQDILDGTTLADGTSVEIVIPFIKDVTIYDLMGTTENEEVLFENMPISEFDDNLIINLTLTEGGYLATVE